MNNNIKLEKAIEAMGIGSGRTFADLFSDFLEMSLGLLCNNPSEHQKRLLKETLSDKEKKSLFIEAMIAYGELAEGYHDPLGEMFMLRVSHGQNGQFFTPEHICDFMARITEPIGEKICDPTCGSGRLLLNGLKISREKGFEPIIYGNDLSYTCAQMTLLNLLVNSARGEVTCGNTLLMDVKNFRFFRIDRVMMPNGAWLSTYWQYTMEDVEEVDKQRDEWRMKMLENGAWVEVIQIRRTATEEKQVIIEEKQAVEETVIENEHLNATPKAVQLELQLF